jgi:hypothetical protein
MLALTRGMLALAIAAGVAPAPAPARDLGQWEKTTPEIRAWFRGLKQPDNPASCCGEADAYWADSYESSSDGDYIAIITDDRADQPLKRQHLPIGTKIVVPKFKMKVDASNPTGHGVIFLNQIVVSYLSDGRDHRLDVVNNTIDGMALVFCYVVPGGI